MIRYSILASTICCLLFSSYGCVHGTVSPSFYNVNPQKIAVLVQPFAQREIPSRLIEDNFVEGLLRKGYTGRIQIRC